MNRRDAVLALLVLGAAPPISIAQQDGKIRRIGFLGGRSRSTPSSPDPYYEAFVAGMRERGYVEGQNLAIEWRFADGRLELLPELASQLARSNVEVLVTHLTQGARALQQATKTIPIVFMSVPDPVAFRLVATLAHPGENITGVSNVTTDLAAKQVEFLKAVLPKLSRLAILANPGTPNYEIGTKNIDIAARRLGVVTIRVDARSSEQIDQGFKKIKLERPQALIVMNDSLFISRRSQIALLSLENRLPTMSSFAEEVMAGSLMSYGPNNADIYRRGAFYVDRILKGAKPNELPVEQPTNVELAINKTTARVLGLAIPPTVLLRANRVIE